MTRFFCCTLNIKVTDLLEYFLPQWECKTAKVQKIASVIKVVWIKGTIKAGICKTETPRSMVHILTWSPELLLTALVAKSCCLATKDPLAVNKGFLMTIFCMQRNCCLIKVVANISVKKLWNEGGNFIESIDLTRFSDFDLLVSLVSFIYINVCLFVTFLFWQFSIQIFYENAINRNFEKYLGFSEVLMLQILRRSTTYHWLLQTY